MTQRSTGPLTVDSRNSGGDEAYKFFVIADLNNAIICDTFNSEVATIHTESDEDGVDRWDERGRVDMEFLARAGNSYWDMLEALKAAEVILRLYNQDFSTNDRGKFRNITLHSTHKEVLAAIAKAEGRS